jgi:predicted TPR repeat methyltransferase
VKKRNLRLFFLVSTEFQATGQSPQLLMTGRYQHSLAYVQSCLCAHGMKLRAFQLETLRTQAQQPIRGGLYLIEL